VTHQGNERTGPRSGDSHMNSLREWAYASGRDRGWDTADRELTRQAPELEELSEIKIPLAYVGSEATIQQFRRGWLYGLYLRRDGLGVDGEPLGSKKGE
jgi:hypothetical protein